MHSSLDSSATDSSATPEAAAPGTRPAVSLGWPGRLGLIALVVCALTASFWPRGDKTFQEPGGFLYDDTGKAATLGPRLAPVTLVHFWATWCPPCIQEIPALQRLSGDFARHHGFKVLMVAVSDSKDKVRSFLGSGSEGVLFDPQWEVANRYGTDKLPETYLVVNGQVVRKFVGMTNWDDPSLRKEIEARLQTSGSTAALHLPGT
ncbi:MAG TPA: TlpA disulfide reductase family protein [Thermoanaerobaculia bacterium]|nr:TlpA disulfide reductase family protein [Thermoanaerobaculia bacterium]